MIYETLFFSCKNIDVFKHVYQASPLVQTDDDKKSMLLNKPSLVEIFVAFPSLNKQIAYILKSCGTNLLSYGRFFFFLNAPQNISNIF